MKFIFTIGAILSCLQGTAAMVNEAPENAMAQLSAIMGDSKTNLARAQRRQEKVVKKMHKQLAQEFVTEAEKLGAGIGGYAQELANARSGLEQAVNLAKDAVAHTVTNTSDWRSPVIGEKAKANALLGAAEHDLHHAERKDTRSVREATEKVSEGIEEVAEKLSMKVGELSSETQAAKDALSGAVDKAQTATKSTAVKNSTAAPNLTAIPQMLEVAMKKAKADASKASSNFEGVLSTAKVDADALEKKTEKALKEAEEKVIQKTLGRGPDRSHTQPKILRGSGAAKPPPAAAGPQWVKGAPINVHPKAKAPGVDPSKAMHIGQGGQKYQNKH